MQGLASFIIPTALIAPTIFGYTKNQLPEEGSALVPKGSTGFQIAGVTYTTKDIVTDLFGRAFFYRHVFDHSSTGRVFPEPGDIPRIWPVRLVS